MYRVALICEGPADREVLKAVLDHYLLEDYELRTIQPPQGLVGGKAGPFGGGWKGVRSWCENEVAAQGGLDRVAVLKNAEILVIQVDADVATEAEIRPAKPCPPPRDSVDEVRALIRKWLGVGELPPKVVLCVPSMASETWALVALLPDHEANVPCDPAPVNGPCIECRTDIKSLLRANSKDIGSKLVTLKQGTLKNHAPAYRQVQDRITKGWQAVVDSCGEARRFKRELKMELEWRKIWS